MSKDLNSSLECAHALSAVIDKTRFVLRDMQACINRIDTTLNESILICKNILNLEREDERK